MCRKYRPPPGRTLSEAPDNARHAGTAALQRFAGIPMTDLLVNYIAKDDGSILISASPHWSILDLSCDDDVIDFEIKDAVYDDKMLDGNLELMVGEYSIDAGKIILWDDNDGAAYRIEGKVSIKKRWFTKAEILELVEQMRMVYQYELDQSRHLQKIIDGTKIFVHEASIRTEIKINAGKKINVLDLLTHIQNKLDA